MTISLAAPSPSNTIFLSLPLLVGLAAIPITVRYLGDARFGLLGLVWAILGYFSVFALGLGRATTKFVSELLETEGEGEPAELSALWQFVLTSEERRVAAAVIDRRTQSVGNGH